MGIDGAKTYITNGHRADFILLVCKTDQDAGHTGSASSSST